jgi:hypothetical protein
VDEPGSDVVQIGKDIAFERHGRVLPRARSSGHGRVGEPLLIRGIKMIP